MTNNGHMTYDIHMSNMSNIRGLACERGEKEKIVML